MKYFIFTYGCQMNRSDSEKIAASLQAQGHKPVRADSSAEALAKADLVVLNACSVRQSAIDRIYGKINQFAGKKIIIAGCLLEYDREKLTGKNVSFWHPNDYFRREPMRQNNFSAFVPVMTGCNNFCSYCVVPFTRGPEKSRPAQEIITEAKSLIKKGFKEIVLLGQNVNSYKDKKNNFPKLLERINDLPGNFWLNFITSHPKDMSDELIETMARCEKVTPYIHLPIQSGNNLILKKMNRRYTIAHYKKLIEKIRAVFRDNRPGFPPIAFSTDIIVGFPGETKKQFSDTVKLVREIKFDMIYFAQYSPRTGTAAAQMIDDVPRQEKMRRAQTLNKVLGQTALALNKKYIGQAINVLINETTGGCAMGKTITNKNIKIDSGGLKPGDLIKAEIISVNAWGLKGKLCQR